MAETPAERQEEFLWKVRRRSLARVLRGDTALGTPEPQRALRPLTPSWGAPQRGVNSTEGAGQPKPAPLSGGLTSTGPTGEPPRPQRGPSLLE
jgi:hypothetical protein